MFSQKSQKYLWEGVFKLQSKQRSWGECGHLISWVSLKPFIDIYTIGFTLLLWNSMSFDTYINLFNYQRKTAASLQKQVPLAAPWYWVSSGRYWAWPCSYITLPLPLCHIFLSILCFSVAQLVYILIIWKPLGLFTFCGEL